MLKPSANNRTLTRTQRKALVARLDQLAQRLHPSGPHLNYRFIVVDYATPDWHLYRGGNCIVCRQFTRLGMTSTVSTEWLSLGLAMDVLEKGGYGEGIIYYELDRAFRHYRNKLFAQLWQYNKAGVEPPR